MIPVERVSKYIRADAILEIAQDMGLERTRIVAVNDWDESRKFMLTFANLGSAKTISIDPLWNQDRVRFELENAIRPAPAGIPPRKKKLQRQQSISET